MFFHPILSAQTMTKLGTRARAPKPLPKSIFLSRGGRGSSNNLRVSILKCPANHARVHSHKKLRKPNPLFTISLQSDGLEIKRKGEGGEKGGKSHGRDEKTKPRFLSRPTSFFFFVGFVGFGVFFLLFPAPRCDFDKRWCGEKIDAGSRSISTLSRAKQSPRPRSGGTHWKLFGKWSMGPRPSQGTRRCRPWLGSGITPGEKTPSTGWGMAPENPSWKGRRNPLLSGELSVEWFNGYL